MKKLLFRAFLFIGFVGVFYAVIQSFVLVYRVSGISMNKELFDGDRVVVKKRSDYGIYSIVVVQHNNDNLIKRIYGLPGDTVRINGDTLFTNRQFALLNRNVKQKSPVSENAFVMSYYHTNWYLDSFGPLFIPSKGSVIQLDSVNKRIYRNLIIREMKFSSDYEYERFVSTHTSYATKFDYLFLMGDNFYWSSDSRMLGLIRSDKVVGTAKFILYSGKTIKRTFRKIT
jgi:signal peptidase I